MESPLNQIQRSTWIRALRPRVWASLTDVAQFCRWFTCESQETAFVPGKRAQMKSVHPDFDHVTFFLDIVEMVPESRFSWRWHPGAYIEGEDLSAEPMTLVTFTLEDAEGGTHVTVTETGFEQIFASRRARVFKENEGGWDYQIAALQKHFGESA